MARIREMWRTWSAWTGVMGLTLMAASCIDEDLSDCGKDYQIVYSLNLHTDLQTYIDQELTSARERELGKRLKAALSDVFVEHAHDVSLAFYTTDSVCSHYEEHAPDAASASFSIYLPVEEYMHLAVANHGVADNGVCMERTDYAPHACVQYTAPVSDEMYPSHRTGLFSARLPMEVSDVNQTFYANLYMTNSASALVINPNGVQVNGLEGCVAGTAHCFSVRDSLYTFPATNLSVCAERLADTGSQLLCLYAVSFPSRDVAVRSRAEDEHEAAWQYRVYVTMPDGRVTESVLYVKDPLKAGRMHIIKASLNDQGGVIPDDPEVGVSIELDWKEGGIFNPEL